MALLMRTVQMIRIRVDGCILVAKLTMRLEIKIKMEIKMRLMMKLMLPAR